MQWFTMVGLAVMLGAPGSTEPPKKAEGSSIVGEWVCTKCVADGRELPEEVRSSIKMRFTADGKFHSQFGPDIGDGTYKADASKDPAELEFTSTKAAKGKKGIYKVDGDLLVLCAADGERGRPTKFESPAGSRIFLMTFTRAKKE